MSLSTGEFVHPFHELFFFFFLRLVIKLTCWNWLLESETCWIFVLITFFRIFSNSRCYLQLYCPCKCCQPISSVAQLCAALCDPMDCSTPGFPVLHYLPEFAHTHVHQVGDAIQPSHPTISSSVAPFFSYPQSFPASGTLPMSQVARVMEFQVQHQSFQCIFRVDSLWDWLVGSPCSPRDSRTSTEPRFESISSSALSFLYGPTLTSIYDLLEKL